jgi:hypothetical protein
MRYLLVILFFIFGFSIFSQYNIGGGFSTFNSTNSGITRVGAHIYVENPHNEVASFFLRGLATLPVKRFDSLSLALVQFQPGLSSFKNVGRERSTTYFAIDGGQRRYLYNTYDSGFAIYSNFHLKGVIAIVGQNVDPYDTELYQPNEPSFDQGTSFLYGFGVDLGFKWQLPYTGAFIFEAGIDSFQRLSDPTFILGRDIGFFGLTLNATYRHDIF